MLHAKNFILKLDILISTYYYGHLFATRLNAENGVRSGRT